MNIIILGDKYQKNMKSKGCVGLIKYNRTNTLLENQYIICKSLFPKSKIVYVYGFDGKKFETYLYDSNKKIIPIYNKNYDKCNAGLSLSLAKDFLKDNCLIMNGNSILNKKIFESFKPNNSSQIFVNKNKKISDIGCIINDCKIQNFSLDLSNNIYNIYYLSRKDSHILYNIIDNKKYNNYFIFELLNKMIDLGVSFVPIYVRNMPNQLSSLDKTLIKK
jgi:CTP:phosphocholine cytidylyltransferase-like protein